MQPYGLNSNHSSKVNFSKAPNSSPSQAANKIGQAVAYTQTSQNLNSGSNDLSSKQVYLLGDNPLGFNPVFSESKLIEQANRQLKVSPTARILYHISGGMVGKHTELGGFNVEGMLNYLNGYKRLSDYFDAKLIEQLKACQFIASSDYDATLLLKTFKDHFDKGKSFLCPTGWIEPRDGHSMYFKFIPESDETVTVRVYNLGEGAAGAGALDKRKIPSYVDWEGVSLSSLLDLHFWQSLEEVMTKQKNLKGQATDYRAADIYQACKCLLQPQKESFPDIEKFKTEQSLNNCTWESISAVLADHAFKESYKCFTIEFELDTLLSFVGQHLKPSLRDWRLVEHVFARLCLLVLDYQKAFKQLPIAELEQKLDLVRNWLQQTKALPDRQNQRLFAPNLIETANAITHELQPFPQNSSISFSPVFDLMHYTRSVTTFTDERSDQTLSLEQWIAHLKTVERSGGYLEVETSISVWLKSVSLENFIRQLPRKKEQLDQLAGQLQSIAYLAFYAIIGQNSTQRPFNIEYAFIFAKLLALQVPVLNSLYSHSWQLSDVLFIREKLLQVSYFSFETPSQIEDWEFFTQDTQPFDDFFYFLENVRPIEDERGKMCALYKDDLNSTKKLLERLKRLAPEVELQLIAQVPGYASMSRSEQTAQFVLHLDKLPGIAAVYHTRLCLKYLNSYLKPGWQIEVNPSTPPTWKWKLTCPNHKSCELTVELQNVKVSSAQLKSPNLTREIKAPALKNVIENPSVVEKEAFLRSTPSDLNIRSVITEQGWIALKWLEYFFHFPSHLENLDLQALFEITIFKPQELSQFTPQVIQIYREFLSQAYENAKQLGTIQVCAFVCKFMYRLSLHFSSSQLDSQALECLKQLMEDKGISALDRSYAYTELLAIYADKKSLDKDQLVELLVGLVHLRLYPLPQSTINPATEQKVKLVGFFHARAIHQLILTNLIPDDRLIHAILSQAGIELPKQELIWKMDARSNHACHFYNEHFSYHPWTGDVLGHCHLKTIPHRILEKLDPFKALFSVYENFFFDGKAYRFDDQWGFSTAVFLVDQRLEVYQTVDDQSYRLITSAKHIPQAFLANAYLVSQYSAWQSVDNPTLWYFRPNGQKHFVYYAFMQRVDTDFAIYQCQEILNLHGQTKLRPAQIQVFEKASYVIEEIDDQGQLVLMRLPRFNLTFTGTKLESKEFAGYQLTVDSVKALKGFDDYLVLENEKGKKKVLIPALKFTKAEALETLKPAYELSYETDAADQLNYYVFDLVKERLVSTSVESNLHLCLVLHMAQHYHSSLQLLNQYASKLFQFSSLEKDYLVQMLEVTELTGDESPLSLALAIRAGIALLKNHIFHQLEITDDLHKKILGQYLAYLKKIKRVGEQFQLSEQQELFLLRYYLFSSPQHLILQRRLKELNQAISFETSTPYQPDNVLSTQAVKQVKPHLEQFPPSTSIRGVKPLAERMISRPEIAKDFWFFYQIAKTGDVEDRQWLKVAISFEFATLKNHEEDAKFLLKVLEQALQFPEQFPDLPRPLVTLDWIEKLPPIAIDDQPRVLVAPAVYPVQPIPTFNPTNFSPIQLKFQLPLDRTLSDTLKQHFAVQTSNRQDTSFLQLQAWASSELTSPIGQHLTEDLAYFSTIERQALVPKVTFEEMQTLIEQIQQDRDSIKQTLKLLKSQIIQQANLGFFSSKEELDRKLWKWGHRIKKISLEQVIVNFGRQSPQELQKLNPALAHKDIEALYQLIGTYVLLSTEYNQQLSVQSFLQNIQRQDVEKADLQAESWQDLYHLSQPLAFNPIEQPSLLVFEYFLQSRLRSEQVQKLEMFLKNKEQSLVAEMIMGFGKSKVIMPLLALLMTEEDAFFLLVLPEALFESIGKDTQMTLWKDFGVALHSLTFDYQTDFSVSALQAIRDELYDIKAKKESLAITAKSIKCILVKFILQKIQDINQKEPSQESQLLQEILILLRGKSFPLFEEADLLLSVIKDLQVKCGPAKPVDEDEVVAISTLYEVLYTNQDVKEALGLNHHNSSVLTPQAYEKYKRALAKKLFRELKHAPWSTKLKRLQIKTFFKELDRKQKRLAFHYVCRTPDKLKEAQAFFDQQAPEIQDLLALIGQEISAFLPKNLFKNYNQHFGFDKVHEDPFAIPYKAANDPSYFSQFANPHVLINYTFQAYLAEGISSDLIERHLKNLQNRALLELKELNRDEAVITKTAAWEDFEDLKEDFEMPLFNYRADQLAQLTAKINQDEESIIDFVRDYILPELEVADQKVSCNVIQLAAFFKRLSGFTGTLWNASSLHSKIQALPERGTDSNTLAILWRDSLKPAKVLEHQKADEMLKEVFSDGFDVLIDAGGYFKDESNESIASKLSALSGKPVAYYSLQGNQVNCDLDPTSRLTYLDQSHTVGADVNQHSKALGVVTIGKDMMLRDLLQAVKRLRKLGRGQRIADFVVTKEVRQLIVDKLQLPPDQTISLKEILQFTIANQEARKATDDLEAFQLELESVIEMEILMLTLNPHLTAAQSHQLNQLLKKYWLYSSEQSARERYGKLGTIQEKDAFLAQKQAFYLEQIQRLYQDFPVLKEVGSDQAKLEKNVEQIIERYRHILADHIVEAPLESGQTVEVEQQNINVAEAESQSYQELEKAQVNSEVKYIYSKSAIKKLESFTVESISKMVSSDTFPSLSVALVMEQDLELKPYASAFKDVNIALNALFWTDDKDISTYKLFGPHKTPLQFYYLMEEKTPVFLTDAEVNVFKEFKKPLYHLTFGGCQTHSPLNNTQQLAIVKMKFLNGEVNFPLEERSYLKNWLKKEGYEKLQTFFESFLLKSPSVRQHYKGSYLERLFIKQTKGMD